MKPKKVAKPRAPATKQRRGEAVEPAMTLRLMEAVGVSRAARMMGTTTTTLHRARNLNAISKVYEVAAAGELRTLGSPDGATETYRAPGMAAHKPTAATPRDTAIFIMEVPSDRVPMAEQFASMVGAKLLRP